MFVRFEWICEHILLLMIIIHRFSSGMSGYMYPVPDTVSIKIKQISYPIRYPVSTLTKICIQSGIRSISKMCIQSGIRYPLCQRIVSNPVSCIHLSNKSYPIRYPVSTLMNSHLNVYLKKQA